MWTSHLIGISIVIAAFYFFAQGISQRSQGRRFNPWPSFLLMMTALIFQFVYPSEDSFWLRIPHMLVDFGLGMAIASGFLALRKFNFKLFLVPGLLSAIIGGTIYGLGFAYESLSQMDSIKSGYESELLLELGEDDHINEKPIQDLLNRYHATAVRAFPTVAFEDNKDLAQVYVVTVCATKIDRLRWELNADTENVDHVEPNRHFEFVSPISGNLPEPLNISSLANDPYFDQQWYAQALNYEAVHATLKGIRPAKKAKVAIVDTGVDPGHEDLAKIYQMSDTDGDYDKHSHGTHCAGLAGAVANNSLGVASMNWEGKFVTISGYAALDDYGRGTDLRVARAIIKAAEDGADVISMSLGGPSFGGRAPKSQVDAITYANKLGAIVVVAAGNSNQDAKGFTPANIAGVICVSAVGPDLRKASFSNTNTSLKMPIASPGVNILSSVPGSKYQSYNGTSMATPIVSGLVGIMRAIQPDITTAEVYELLVSTGATGEDVDKVGRLIQPQAVLQAMLVPQ